MFATAIIFCGCSSQQIFRFSRDEDRPYKDKLIEVARRVYQKGLVWGSGGDISVRVPGKKRFIIKATGNCFGDLDYKRLSTVGLDGRLCSGSPKPSHETNIHLALYNLNEDIGAIMHVHSPYAAAWATAGEKIPQVTQQSVKLLRNAGLIRYYPPGSKEMLDAVVGCYKNRDTSVVLMENHGVFFIGKDLYDILYKAEVVENTARIAYLLQDIGDAKKFIYIPPVDYDEEK